MSETRVDRLADENERLREVNAELRAALKPFADYVDGVINPTAEGLDIVFGMLAKDDNTGWQIDPSATLTMRAFINARAAIAKAQS